MGIEHGFFVGTNLHYIWTLDLVLTLPWLPIGAPACSVVSVKPLDDEAYTGDVDPLARSIQKLDVEWVFAGEIAAGYFVADRSIYPGPFLGQLELFHSCSWPPEERTAYAIEDLLQRFGPELATSSPREWGVMLRLDFGLDSESADYAVHHMIWHQTVDVDISKQVSFDSSPTPGGRALIERIRRSLTERHP
jgi:hypothetical protein